jgi:hypothetical protein
MKSQEEAITQETEYISTTMQARFFNWYSLFFPKLPPQVGHFSSAEDTLDPQNSQVNSKFSWKWSFL